MPPLTNPTFSIPAPPAHRDTRFPDHPHPYHPPRLPLAQLRSRHLLCHHWRDLPDRLRQLPRWLLVHCWECGSCRARSRQPLGKRGERFTAWLARIRAHQELPAVLIRPLCSGTMCSAFALSTRSYKSCRMPLCNPHCVRDALYAHTTAGSCVSDLCALSDDLHANP